MASNGHAELGNAATAPTEPFLQPAGPSVPRSHSFLPLRCGPPIYFPLPAPYDEYCLTGVLPSDLREAEEVQEEGDAGAGDEDVQMGNESGESSGPSSDGKRRVKDLGEVQGSGGWEYPIIRRIAEIKALATDSSSTPAIVGAFSFGPASLPAPSEPSWNVRDVWITAEERQKGLASLVITYIIHSWFLRLPGTPPRLTARANPSNPTSNAFLTRLVFQPEGESGAGGSSNGDGEVEYTWSR